MTDYTKQDLIDFEEGIKREFLAGHIRFPIHLSAGNEQILLDLFKANNIGLDSWVFSTHRCHLHALLKGIPKEWLKKEILKGNSMHIMSKEYKFFASSIVGGSLPIAVGTALAIKRQGLNERVFAFCGDMAFTTGIFDECLRYARNFNLPIYFIVECNNLSTNSPTDICWGYQHKENYSLRLSENWGNGGLTGYCYERKCPHINVDSWVVFK